MIDTEARPARRHRKRYYICSLCRKNLVSRKGGRCKWCACKIREENYKALGLRRPKSLSSASISQPIKLAKNKSQGACPSPASPTGAHFQKITSNNDGSERGECVYCHTEFLYPPQNEGKRKLHAMGGVKSGKLRGGRRGRPRKIRDAIGDEIWGIAHWRTALRRVLHDNR